MPGVRPLFGDVAEGEFLNFDFGLNFQPIFLQIFRVMRT